MTRQVDNLSLKSFAAGGMGDGKADSARTGRGTIAATQNWAERGSLGNMGPAGKEDLSRE